MNRMDLQWILSNSRTLGRTLADEKEKILYMNWTCSGMEFEFTGKRLDVEFRAIPGAEIDVVWSEEAGDEQPTPRDTWPWVGVCLDDSDDLSMSFELSERDAVKTVFDSEEEETHKIRLVKLTENPKGKVGVKAFCSDGSVSRSAEIKRPFVEFVGDSITCGFGNMSTDRDRLFFSEDENGWYSHAAIAGRLLDIEAQLISYSGICVVNHSWLPQPYGMSMLYPYQDRVLEDTLEAGREEERLTCCDFSARHRDVVVLNLGTNDATGIMFQEDKRAAEAEFVRDYPVLIRQIRELNGPDTHIVCALGSIDYMLFNDIEQIVARYREETGDEKISTFRYYKMAPLEGVSPCGHPTKATHERMGREIADYLRTLLQKGQT